MTTMPIGSRSPGEDHGLAAGEVGRGARRKPASSGAQATAEWRRRRQQGAVLVTVEVSAADIELLVRTRWLSAGEAHDRSDVGDAVARLLGRVLEQLGSRAGRT